MATLIRSNSSVPDRQRRLAVFIMRTTKAGFKAAHFAIGTGLMNIAGTMAGVFSGFLASAVGFPVFFGLTILLTLPNMALIPWLPVARDNQTRYEAHARSRSFQLFSVEF